MDYCCEIWGNRFNSHIELITKLQKRAARLILKCNMFTSSKEMFSKLKWMPFKQRVQYFKCLFVFKCINNLSSEFYADIFKPIYLKYMVETQGLLQIIILPFPNAVQNIIIMPSAAQEVFYGMTCQLS